MALSQLGVDLGARNSLKSESREEAFGGGRQEVDFLEAPRPRLPQSVKRQLDTEPAAAMVRPYRERAQQAHLAEELHSHYAHHDSPIVGDGIVGEVVFDPRLRQPGSGKELQHRGEVFTHRPPDAQPRAPDNGLTART
jgi:hypothetical protein